MSKTLTIRNASALLMTLVEVERFEALTPTAASQSYARPWRFQWPSTPATILPISPTSDQLKTASDSFHSQTVSVNIPPFLTTPTTISTSEGQDTNSGTTTNFKLRLVFAIAKQRYRLDLSSTEGRAIPLIPLNASSGLDISAIYLATSSFLILLRDGSPERWMASLPDTVSIAQLSIPGTHNSPTHHRAAPSVRCQAVSVRKQLDNGVRFLDVRLQPASATDLEDERLYLVHSVFSVCMLGYYDFRGLVDRVYAFLEQNPSESVLISLKREGLGKATDTHLARILKKHYIDKSPTKWVTQPQIPSLGEARGKLVLMRRFGYDDQFATEDAGLEWGIDATSWADNSPSSLNPTGQLCIQDFYNVLESVDIDKKISYVESHLARATSAVVSCAPGGTSPCLFINFMSGSNFWKVECWPERIATRLNPAILEYLCREHMNNTQSMIEAAIQPVSMGSTGIVVCDWVGKNGNWDLVRTIVAMNEVLRSSQDVPELGVLS